MANNFCSVDPGLFPAVEEMLAELNEAYQEVQLIPSIDAGVAADGGCIRAAVNQNPKWYRDLCSAHPKAKQRPRKKPQTSLKKADILWILRSILRYGGTGSKYLPWILDEAKRRSETEEFIPFNNQF